LILIGFLFALSVPWYRAPDAPERLLFGLPDWMVLSIACYVGIAVLLVATRVLTEDRKTDSKLRQER
jgi:hypothetical protein